jgi:hypothetical protein
MHVRGVVPAAVTLATLALAPTARADDPRAEQLYVEGKQLAAQGNYAEACPKLEESQKIEPAIGTQLDLADCYERTHRPATALGTYREVARIAQMSGQHDRQHAAEERIAQLERTAPRLFVIFMVRAPGLRVERDGVPMTEAELASGEIVDPGEHVVRATAPKFREYQARVQIVEGAGPVVLDVVALEREPEPPPPSAASPGLSPFRIAAIATVSTGLAALVVGGVFGVTAIAKKNDAGCVGVDCGATPDHARSLHDAQTAATTSTVFFVVGGVLVAGGVALWLLAPRPRASSLAPLVHASPAGVGGTF